MAFVDTKIVARTDWTDGLWTMRVDAALDAFEPGQFVNLGLDVDGELVKRAYSLASPPGRPPEFYLVRVEGGALTPRLCRLGVGDPLKIETTAQGFFTLEHVPESRDMWLISTGTGLGPFMSMLRSGVLWSRFDNVVLVNGARHAADLGYADELEQLASSRDGFRYLPLITREDHEVILRGRIPALLRNGFLEKAADFALDPAHAHVMLCGNPAMIRDTIDALGERDMRKHRTRKPGHITAEKYW
jgi:ferredoxin--NADP+ reductase